MKKIEIEVEDNDFELVKSFLENMRAIKSINVKTMPSAKYIGGGKGHEVVGVSLASEAEERKKPYIRASAGRVPDEITESSYKERVVVAETTPNQISETALLSQASLAEEWNSEEDDRYDELYAKSKAAMSNRNEARK